MKINNKTLKLPLIQGGMGVGVSFGGLAGAVANQGGVGVISTADTGFKHPDFWKNPSATNMQALRDEIKKARQTAGDNAIIGINAMVATSNYADCVKTAVKEGVDCIISGAGLPLDLPSLVGDSTVSLAPIVSGGRAAAMICKVWQKRYNRLPDFFVVEGPLAGGHLGFDKAELLDGTAKSLEEIIPEVIEKISGYKAADGKEIPVFAAGGIYTSQDVMRFIGLGAYGVQVATRFIATEECDADISYKNAIINSKKEDIKIVKSPAGMPGRAIRNALIKRLETENIKPSKCVNCLVPCNIATTPYCITNALINAVNGDTENGLLFCGSNAWRIDKITTVPQLIDELMLDWRKTQ